MSEKLTRRSAVTLSLAAPTMGYGFPLGGEIDSSMVGVNIKIAWHTGGWAVWLPDWEALGPYFRPGMVVPGKWVPLANYLHELETEFDLVAKS